MAPSGRLTYQRGKGDEQIAYDPPGTATLEVSSASFQVNSRVLTRFQRIPWDLRSRVTHET